MSPLSEVLAATIASYPDCVVLSGPSGNATWRQLDLNSDRLITVIENTGQRDSIRFIVIGVPIGGLFLASIIAAIKMGIAYIPASPAQAAALDLGAIGCAPQDVFVVDQSTAELIAGCSSPRRYGFKETLSTDPLYGIMTSGTTGAPKIPLLPRKTIELLSDAFADRLGGERLVWSALHVTTFGFSTLEYFMPMLLKGRIYIPSNKSSGTLNGPTILVDALQKDLCCDVTCLTPSAFQVFLAEAQAFQIKRLPQFIILSGEGLSAHLLEQWFNSPWCSTTEVITTYASAEAGGQVFWKQLSRESGAKDLGTPLPHVLPMLLNDDATIITTPGIGRLALASEAAMIGYLNSDVQRHIDVESEGGIQRVLLTDDIVERKNDGSWHYVGRLDSLVKHHGKFADTDRISSIISESLGFQQVKTHQLEMADGRKRLISFGLESTAEKIELWPALGEFNQYDRFTYGIMAQEGAITSRFIQAVRTASVGRSVLDIGCGSDLLISRLAASAGASRVVAFEIDEQAAAIAAVTARDSEFKESIKVLCADAAILNETLTADVAITRIFGNIASADGVIPVVRNLNRISKSPLTWLPSIARTRIAAIDLGPLTSDRFSVCADSEQFFLKVERRLKKDYRGRICIRNFSTSRLISNSADFEVLNFCQDDYILNNVISLAVEKKGFFSGLILWVQTESENSVFDDFLAAQKGWLPVYLPTCLDPVPVMPGEQINLKISSPDYMATNPDYCLEITVLHDGHIRHRSQFNSEHFSSQPQPWHAQISRIRNHNDPRFQKLSHDMALQRLRQILGDEEAMPEMVVPVDQFPLTANGKTDYAKLETLAIHESKILSDPDTSHHKVTNISRRSLETICLDVFRACLTTEADATSDIFHLGASSLDLASITTLLSTRLEIQIPISLVYDAPTAQLLSSRLYVEHFETTAQPPDTSSPQQDSIDLGKDPLVDSRASESSIDRFDLRFFRDACQQLHVEPPVCSLELAKPVFLLAPPGSGLVWLRLILSANPAIFAAPELQLLHYNRISEWQRKFQDSMIYQNAFADLVCRSGVSPSHAVSPKQSRSSNEDLQIQDLYTSLLSGTASGIYLETSTSYGLYPEVLNRLLALFPQGRIVHLVRDPVDCIASQDSLPTSSYPFVPFEDYKRPQLMELIWYQTHQNILQSFSDLGPERYLRISYGSLLEKPSHILTDLCTFLDVAPLPLWQTDLANATETDVSRHGSLSGISSFENFTPGTDKGLPESDVDTLSRLSRLSDWTYSLYERLQS